MSSTFPSHLVVVLQIPERNPGDVIPVERLCLLTEAPVKEPSSTTKGGGGQNPVGSSRPRISEAGKILLKGFLAAGDGRLWRSGALREVI